MAATYTTYSTARIDTLVCPVMVDASELKSCLPQGARLSLPQLQQVPTGKHPVIVEIWRVQDGLLDYGGVSAHQWWELAGGAAGLGLGGSAGAAVGFGKGWAEGAAKGAQRGMRLGPLGWWWGAATEAAMSAAAEAAKSAAAAAQKAASMTATFFRSASERTSRAVGTYNEIVVTTPCRRLLPRGREREFGLVLASYTDSAASILGERLIGWGYQKLPAFGIRSNDGVLEVSTRRSGMSFKISSHPDASRARRVFDATPAAQVIDSLSLPLLGALSADQMMVSHLERSFNHRDVRMTPVKVHLEASAGFIPRLGKLTEEVKGSGENSPWGAISVTGLPVTLSYPRNDSDETA